MRKELRPLSKQEKTNLDNLVDAWHRSQTELSLQDFLEMDEDEYGAFVIFNKTFKEKDFYL